MDLKQEQKDNSEKSVPWDLNLAAIIEYLLKKLVQKKPRIWDGVVIEYNWHFRFSELYVMSKFLLVMIFLMFQQHQEVSGSFTVSKVIEICK